MKKILFIAILITMTWIELSAQTAQDALRYSRIFYNGTSRFVATGGAFGAVGADFSSIATNPAGLGMYRSAEVTFSPSVFSRSNTADYNG
ncbi:TonB-dependent receptor, partial [Bacteroidota bacterium]